jgi:hypothetical protein
MPCCAPLPQNQVLPDSPFSREGVSRFEFDGMIATELKSITYEL